MDYYFSRLKRELAALAEDFLNAEDVVVENAGGKSGADLAIPVFAFAGGHKKPPGELAKELAGHIDHADIGKIEPYGGFVNIWLDPKALAAGVAKPAQAGGYGKHTSLSGQEIVIEHTDPNPFKELHIGHIYSNTVGESLARLHESAGAEVRRVSYHGDVGLHIAKAVWALGNSVNWQKDRLDEDLDGIGAYYVQGAKAFDEKEAVVAEIKELNKKIYERSDEKVNAVYDWGKARSFAYFDEVYRQYGSPPFEAKFLESESGPKGLKMVKEHVGGVFEESEGAIVFRDEEEHTRVFISSDGLPTYEAKDLGLAELKKAKYPGASQYVIITANEINAYFNVVLKALKQIDFELAERTRHLSHGLVKLPEGKMSSRSGNVPLAKELLGNIEELIVERSPEALSPGHNALAAIKYAFLKQNIGGDIVYDAKESVNLEGQTGPYVQYATVRIQSILDKTESASSPDGYDWQAERPLLVLLAKYPEATALAVHELAPHRVAQYVYELARQFNRYYETTPVKDAPNGVKTARVETLKACLNVLSKGLELLNIPVPRKM